MIAKRTKHLIFLTGFSLFLSIGLRAQVKDLPLTASSMQRQFKDPPPSYGPWVIWYWMQASVSREGITADLEAMKKAGIRGAFLMSIKGPANPPYMDSVVVQLTPAWWNLVRHAMSESRRLGLKLAFHISDGFALAGGPWITPELSMQKIVWSAKNIKGGGTFSGTLEQPETIEGYYRDIAVFAYPSPEGTGISTRTVVPVITSSTSDTAALLLATPGNNKSFGCDDQCWVQYEFQQPFTCRSIYIRSRNNYQSNRLRMEVSNDGKNFRSIGRLVPPRHGWQDWDAGYTHAIPATTARYFRFVFDKTGSEPGAEDLDAAKWKPSLRLTGIELSSEGRIHQFEGKNGTVWRISENTSSGQVPNDLAVPLNRIINLTDRLDSNGRLNWDAPNGNWTLLRIGHTSTGHKNETAGGGKGLECDKFNPVAINLQFDNWFGEMMRQAGPGLARSVLEMLHIDSWECGSQNWSPVFRDEFKKRRGYDLLPYLPVMTGLPVQSVSVSERFLHDVRQTIAELVSDNFYATISALARKNDVLVSAESVAPTMLSDGMLHYREVDVPMGEFWLRSPTHDKPNDMLDAISGAHIYGKKIIQAEGFTQLRMDWDEYPGNLKTLLDRNYALGINRLAYHVFVHNPWMDRKPGMTLDAIGLYFQRDQTWWNQSRAWVDYARRCQLLLQAGEPVTDIAVFTGEDLPRRAILPDRLVSVLPGIFGARTVAKEKIRLENAGQPLRELPRGVRHSANITDTEDWPDPLHGYKYDSYNRDALLRLSSVKNNRIVLSTGASYQLLVVPGKLKMSPNSIMSIEVLSKLRELAAGGATILVQDFPAHTTGLSKASGSDVQLSHIIRSITKQSRTKLAGLSSYKIGRGRILTGNYPASSFSGLGFSPDLDFKNADGTEASGITWNHRRGKDFDLYFISNQKDSVRILDVSLRVSGRVPEIWDPVTGEIKTASQWKIEKGRTLLPVQLERNGSLFIVLKQNTSEKNSNKGNNWIKIKNQQEITGSWKVQFDSSFGGPATPVVFETLSDWSHHPDSSIRYYSGTARYSKTVIWQNQGKGQPFFLDLGRVENIAEVFVNDKSCGIAWTYPYRVEIGRELKPGANTIRVEVSNTWANRLMGDHRLPEEKRITRTISPYRLEGKPLLSAGLLGPVKILEME